MAKVFVILAFGALSACTVGSNTGELPFGEGFDIPQLCATEACELGLDPLMPLPIVSPVAQPGGLACSLGRLDCDGVTANGCEVISDRSSLHCGGCGNTCGAAGVCVQGRCDSVVSLGTGAQHACALRENGQMACWGLAEAGQLGPMRGGADLSRVALPVTAVSDVADMVGGLGHSCALHETGEVSCWGDNANGQLGSASVSFSDLPQQVDGLPSAQQLVAGAHHTCALTAARDVYCWGDNTQLQLGVPGLTAFNDAPQWVPGLADIVRLSAGAFHTCAIAEGGATYCWGDNGAGQLGHGELGLSALPARVAELDDAVILATGSDHSCALRRDGSVACWGSGEAGRLGDARVEDSRTPVVVAGLPQKYK